MIINKSKSFGKSINTSNCRFKKISGNKEHINKPTFQQNMGILGLHSVFGFSDRLFNSFDTDIDGKVNYFIYFRFLSRILLSTWKFSNLAVRKTKQEFPTSLSMSKTQTVWKNQIFRIFLMITFDLGHRLQTRQLPQKSKRRQMSMWNTFLQKLKEIQKKISSIFAIMHKASSSTKILPMPSSLSQKGSQICSWREKTAMSRQFCIKLSEVSNKFYPAYLMSNNWTNQWPVPMLSRQLHLS